MWCYYRQCKNYDLVRCALLPIVITIVSIFIATAGSSLKLIELQNWRGWWRVIQLISFPTDPEFKEGNQTIFHKCPESILCVVRNSHKLSDSIYRIITWWKWKTINALINQLANQDFKFLALCVHISSAIMSIPWVLLLGCHCEWWQIGSQGKPNK